MAVNTVLYEGRRYTPDMRDAVKEVQRLCPFTVRVTQGGFNSSVPASGATHHGDAVDFSVDRLSVEQVSLLVETCRKVGLAAWFRTTSVAKWGTRAQGFGGYHVHAVPNRWGSPSSAAYNQATAYRAGRDGLLRNLADLGPGHVGTYRTRTWHQYVAASGRPTPTEDIMAGITEAQLRKMIAEEVAKVGVDVTGQIFQALERPRYGEYIDEDGKGRDTRSVVDILFSTHRSSIQNNRLLTAIAQDSGVDVQAVLNELFVSLEPMLREAARAAMADGVDVSVDVLAERIVDEMGNRFNNVK